MIEVVIDSIRISLISQHRVVMLRDADGERQLPIWIGPCEAEAITIELQDNEIPRPLAHDLMKNIIAELGGTVSHIIISELRDSVYYARLLIDVNGEITEVDCRPSDAIALAVRVKVPLFIENAVMDEAGIVPEMDLSEDDIEPDTDADGGDEAEASAPTPEELDAFRNFVDTLDFDESDES